MESWRPVSDVLIAGHIAVDEVIDFRGQISPRRSLGGPASYSSLALTSLGFKPEVISKVGEDFPVEYCQLLQEKAGLDISHFISRNEKTTRFRIDRSINPRRLWLVSKCRDLSSMDFRLNSVQAILRPKALIVNSVAGEISLSLLDRISKEFDLVFVDSQGFVRKFSKNGEVEMRFGLDISSLSGVDFLKADRNELIAWTGLKDWEASIRQVAKFTQYLIITSGPGNAEIFEGQKLRWRSKPLEVNIADTTGAGDIFLAVFAATFSQSENIQTALSTAICAATLSLETKGIEKAFLSRQRIERASSEIEVRQY